MSMRRYSYWPLVITLSVALVLFAGCGDDDEDIDAMAPSKIDNLSGARLAVTPTRASLIWTAPGDDADEGRCSDYSLRFHTEMVTEGNWDSIQLRGVLPQGVRPKPSGELEAVEFPGLSADVPTYFAAIKAVDDAGNWSALSNVVELTISGGGDTTPPGRVDDLDWVVVTAGAVTLTWTAPGDDGDQGTAAGYDLRYAAGASIDWAAATTVTGEPTPQAAGSTEYFTMSGLVTGSQYTFALVAVDEEDNVSTVSVSASATTAGAPQQVWADTGGGEHEPSWSPDGTTLALSSTAPGNYDIYVIPAGGGVATQLTTYDNTDTSPTWSPDGSLIAFHSKRADGGRDIKTIAPDGTNLQDVVVSTNSDTHPDISPDGVMLAFSSDRNGNADIWRLALSGPTAGTYTQISDDAGADEFPCWSPDGTKIAFTREVGGNEDIYVVTVATGATLRITTHAEDDRDACWSPDGEWLVFGSRRSGSWNVYLTPATGGVVIPVTDLSGVDSNPDWKPLPDPTRLVIASNRSGSRDVWTIGIGLNMD